MRLRLLLAAVVAALSIITATAFAAADLDQGTRALKDAYAQSEGDEGGFDGIEVEQCRTEGENKVRCVIVQASGTATDLPTKNYVASRTPLDFGVATFAPDGRITTSREPFGEPATKLDSDIRVNTRIRLTRLGNVVVSVSPDVPATVTARGWFGTKAIADRNPVPVRTLEVPRGRTSFAMPLNSSQKAAIRSALRRTGSIRALLAIRVQGDVGPALATEDRQADVRVVR